MRARSGLAELRGVRAGPSVQNQDLADFNGTSNNIKSLKGCKATTLKLQWSTIYNSDTIYISGTQVTEEVVASRRHLYKYRRLLWRYEHKLMTVEHKQLHIN